MQRSVIGLSALSLIALAGCSTPQLTTAGTDVAAFQTKAQTVCTSINADEQAADGLMLVPVVAQTANYLGAACTTEAIAGAVTEEAIAFLETFEANFSGTVRAVKSGTLPKT